MENKIVVANLKMNMLKSDISKYLKETKNLINTNRVVICPTSIYIPYFLNQKYSVGIQDLHYDNDGICTGEVTPKQAKSMGINFAIIGHSERRKYFEENDDLINKKVVSATKEGIKTIVCIGETKEERNMLKTAKVLRKQLIKDLNGANLDNVIIAYEPIWAIGSNIICNETDISKTAIYIKQLVKNYFNYNNIKVIYGGSVNEENIKDISKIEEIDGVLVGSSSIDSSKFLKIIEVACS